MNLLHAIAAPRRSLARMAQAADRAFAADSVSRWDSPLAATLILATVLALLVLLNAGNGFDMFDFVNGDTLYPVQMLEHGWFDYRPPPPNRLFPDIFAHWLFQPLFPDPLAQKLAVGIAIFVVTFLLVGMTKGLMASALFGAVYLSNGFEVLVSASHYSLPLTVLIFMFARGGRWELPVLFGLTFCNPLVLLPLAFVLVGKAPTGVHLARLAAVLAALALNTAYSEFSSTFLQIMFGFPIWYAGAWVAMRLGLRNAAMAAACVVLPLAAALDIVFARYAVSVAASILLLMMPDRQGRLDWQVPLFMAGAIAIFFVSADWQRHDRVQAGYQCVVEELAARGISAIAAGHWTAKPLHFEARRQGVDLTITQTDFARNASHPWMAPHSFNGVPTQWALRDDDTCAFIDGSATYCGQATVAPVAVDERLCGMFDLYNYETTVPANYQPAPSGKLEAISRNFMHYVGVVMARLR